MVSQTAAAATKRTGAKAPQSAPPAKKAKMDPNCKGILEALESSDLPVHVKNMLAVSAPKAFETAKENRHFTQSAMVAMIGEAIEGVVTKMDEDLSTVTKQVDESEEQRSKLAAEEEAKTAAVTQALEATTAAQSTLKELSERLEATKAALKESREAQSQGDIDFNTSKAEKAALEAIMSSSLAAIVEGSAEDLSEHLEKLKPFVEGMQLDDSLRSALPSSCLQKADVRGNFGHMVVKQIRTCFEERFEALRSAVESGEPAAQERAALVATREAEVTEATNKVEEATKRVAEVEAAGAIAAAELDAAQAALKEYMVKHSELQQSRESKAEELENFKAYNVACFDLLSNKTSAPVEPTTTAVSGGA